MSEFTDNIQSRADDQLREEKEANSKQRMTFGETIGRSEVRSDIPVSTRVKPHERVTTSDRWQGR